MINTKLGFIQNWFEQAKAKVLVTVASQI